MSTVLGNVKTWDGEKWQLDKVRQGGIGCLRIMVMVCVAELGVVEVPNFLSLLLLKQKIFFFQ